MPLSEALTHHQGTRAFVVHIENDIAILNTLRDRVKPMGFPFEPSKGKGTKGFKASNIWVGRQYFEIIRLFKKDGGGWTPHWVDRHNAGQRGLFCMFLLTDDITAVARQLKEQGLPVGAPERITFKAFFGLFKKTLPWQLIYLPPIPGTNLEVGFIQYDPDPRDYVKQFMVPNADENGIAGIFSSAVKLPLTQECKTFLQKVFPACKLEDQIVTVELERGHLSFIDEPAAAVHVNLKAKTTRPELCGASFALENVTVDVEL